jgi:hypothetical protein
MAKRAKPTAINEGIKIGVVWSLLFIVFDALTVVPLEGWSYARALAGISTLYCPYNLNTANSKLRKAPTQNDSA